MSNNRIINIATIAYLAFLLIILAIFGYTPTNDTDGYLEYACIKEKHIHVVLLLRALLLYGTLAPST